jgi:hypothetical protein
VSFLKHSHTLATQYPALYTALAPRFSVIFERYGLKSVVTALEIQSLDILPSVNPQFAVLFPIQGITSANIYQFWQSSNILSKRENAITFQSIFLVKEPYPQPAKLFKSSNLLTLVNDTISKRRPFVDLIRGLAHAALMMKDFPTLNSILETLPEFRPWVFLSDHTILAPDPLLFYSTLELFDSEGWPFNLNNRFKNDDNLFKFLRHILGDYTDDLTTISIPKLLEPVLSMLELPNLHFFQTSDFFTLSDADRDTDFFFIFAFRAIVLILTAFDNNVFDDEVLDFCVQNSGRAEDLSLDLFSLLFLQKDGHFICPLPIARQILGVLVPYSHSQTFVATGFAKVQRHSVLNAELLSDCFVSNLGSFLSALSNHDFILAEVTAAGDLRLSSICEAAKNVAAALAGGPITESAQSEWPLITQDRPCETIAPNTAVSEIILRRRGRTKDDVIAPFETVEIAESVERHFETHEEVDLSKVSLGLRAFIERFALFTQIADSSDDFVSALVQSERVTDWASIEQLLGSDALEKILVSCDLTRATPKMISAIAEVSPIVAKTITVVKEGFPEKRSVRLSLLEKLVDPEMREAIAGQTSGKYFWIGKGIVKGHERMMFDHFWQYFKDRDGMNEEVLFALLDLADQLFRCQIPDSIVGKFFNEIFEIEPFPMKFTEELKMRCRIVDENERKFNIKLRQELFPETVTLFTNSLDSLGIDESNPTEVLEKLLEINNLTLAVQFASHHRLLELFWKLTVDRVSNLFATGDNPTEFLREEKSLAYGVLERLPRRRRTSDNENILLDIVGIKRANDVKTDLDSEQADDLLIEAFESSSISSISSFICDHFRHLFNPSRIIPQIITDFIQITEHISVSNPIDETNAFGILRRIHFLLSQISQSLPVVVWLLEFVSRSFNLRFHISYTFKDVFNHPDRLLTFCLNYDDFPLLSAAKETWTSFDISRFLLQECQLCFTLNETNAAIPFIKYQTDHPSTFREVSWLVGILVHPLPCGIRRSTEIIRVELTPMDYWVRCVIGGESAVAIPRENLEISEYLIRAFGGELELVKYKASKGDFQIAFGQSLSLEAWIGSVLQPALGYNYWGTLWRYLLKNVTVFTAMRSMLSDIADFLRDHKCFGALFDIQNRLDLREDAILTLTEMANCHTSWIERIESMSKLESLINREMIDRRNGKRPQKISDTSLSRFLQIASIMSEFSESCQRWNINFDTKLNVFRSEIAIEPMTFFSLFHKEFSLALKIANLKPNILELIVRKLVETLSCGGNGETTRYLREMGEKVNGADYERLASQFVVAAVEKLRKSDIPSFITGTVKGTDLQVKLLIRFGLLRQAKDICENPRLLTLIYNAALEQRDKEVAEECRRMLAR